MKRIIIIGAEIGLGLGLAVEFFDRGYHVTATCRKGDNYSNLKAIGNADPSRLAIKFVDIADNNSVTELEGSLTGQVFDIMFYNAGIFGPMQHSLLQAKGQLFLAALGPVRLAKRLEKFMERTGGMITFMTSNRASIADNIEGAVEFQRASEAALNSLTRNLYFHVSKAGRSVLNVHPGCKNVDMITLNSTASHEIEPDVSVKGVADVVEEYYESGELIYVGYKDKILKWQTNL
ncbi:MAG: SDR family NAD(P)-dependent oxidoreductase [Mucilaginibacter sp.]